jgi:hypothetical protein
VARFFEFLVLTFGVLKAEAASGHAVISAEVLGTSTSKKTCQICHIYCWYEKVKRFYFFFVFAVDNSTTVQEGIGGSNLSTIFTVYTLGLLGLAYVAISAIEGIVSTNDVF